MFNAEKWGIYEQTENKIENSNTSSTIWNQQTIRLPLEPIFKRSMIFSSICSDFSVLCT